MGSEEESLPRPCLPRQPRLLPRAGRVPPHWSRGRSPMRGRRGHRRIPMPVHRRPGAAGGGVCAPEGPWPVHDGNSVRGPGYQNGGGPQWNASFAEGQFSPAEGSQRRAEGPIRGHSVPDPYHGASRREDEDGWEDVLPPVSSSYSLPELPNLSEVERQSILEVIRRDEHLRRQDELRVMRLKAELQFLRRKGALRADWEPGAQTGASPGVGGGIVGGIVVGSGGGGVGIGIGGNGGGRACARCRAELGRIINRGAFCRACRLRVCKACREYNVRATDWVCSVCHKHMEIQVATGEWMNEFVRRPSRRRDNRVYVPAADIVKRSIRRSWTISTSHRRSFGGPHGSPELRAYSSLPRGSSYLPAASAAAEAAADAADAADARRTSSDNRDSSTPTHRRLPAHPLLSLLRRGSSSGADDIVPTRRSSSLDEEATAAPLARDDSVFVEKLSDASSTSPGKKAIGRKGVSLRRQQAVWAGSTGSTGAESSGGESPGVVPKSPKNKEPGKVGKLKEKPKETEDGLINKSGGVGEKGGGGKEEEEEEEPVEDFDVEPISGAIFRKVTIRKKKKKKSSGAEEEIDGECDDAGQVGDAPATPSPSPSPTVAPSPSLGRSEKQLQQPAESSRRLGAQDSIDGGVGGGGSSSPAAAALLLDYVLDENKIQPDGEDYKLVFISSDSSSKASTTNSDEEAPAEEDCDWDYFEPARAVVVKEIGADGEEGVVGITPPPSISPAATPVLPAAQLRPTPTPSPPPPPPASRLPEVSKLLPATQSGAGEPCAAGELLPRRIEGEEAGPLEAGCGVVALGDHIFFVEPMPASEGASEGQAGIDGGSAASRRARRRRSRRVGRSRSETDLARLHLRLAPAPDDARAPGERSGSGGFVIDEVPTIVAAGEFGAVEGMRMWTVERDSEEDDGDPEGRKRRTIIPVPVPVPVPSWPERFQREKRDESGAHAIPRGSLGDAVSVADIVYLGPAGSNAVRIRIRSFQRCTSASQEGGGSSRPSVTHVSLVGSASPSPASSWYAWHGVLDANAPSPSSAAPSPPGFTSSVALSASLQDCYSGDGGGGGVGAVLDQIGCGELKEIVEINPSERLSAEIIEEEKLSDTGEKQQLAGEGADAAVNDGGLATAVGSTRPPEAVHEADTESGAAVEADDRRGEGEEKEAEEEGGGGKRMEEAVSTATESIYCEGNAEKTFRNEANFLDMEDTRVNGDVPSLDAIKDVSAEPLECESVTEEAVIMTVGEGERSATVGKEEKGEGEGGEGEERGGEERTISLALTIEVDEDEERRRDDGERRNGLTLDKEGFPRDNESGMEETRAAVSSSSRTERNREERGIIREGVEGGPSVEAKEETSEARESGVDKGIRSDCDKEMESDKEGDEKVTDEMSSAGEESPIPAGRGVEGERIEKEGEENNDDLAGEVLEREECDRIECVVEVLSSAADSEESGGNVIKEERSGTSEAEITASRGENYYYKRSETLENRAESVLIEEEVDGDVGKNKLPLGDKTVEEMGAIPREEEEETGGRDKDALTAEVGIIELAVDAGDGNVAVLEGCPSEGNETKSEDAAPKEESSVAKEEDTEEDEFNEVNREEEMSGDEKSAEESVVLLSHKPLESCEDEVKPPSDGAREKASVATPPSHTLGAREVSQLLEEGEKVGVLSSVGGVVEEWEGKEVGLPRPFSATSTRPTAAERGEEDRTEGEATESSGTPRSVVREIPRGVDESSSERELAARAGETEGAPSPARDESNSNNQTGGGRKRGKRKRNRKRKRRRGKVNKATEEEGEIIPIEPSECCPLPAKMEGEGSDEEESVAAPDSDEYETSSGEFDLATGPRWASIMTPPSVSSNSDAAGNSEESDSDDENFSRVFVVNPADDEEDEGVGRERAEEDEEEEEEDDDVEGRGGVEVIADDGMVKVVRLEGAVLPYGGAGVRLMHIRALTDDDHVATPRSKDVAAVVGDVVIEGQDGLRASGDLPPFKEMADGGVGGSVREVSDSSSEKPLYPESSKEIGIDKCEIEREDFRANGSRTESGCSLIPSCGRDDSHIIDKTDGREFIIKDSSATALDKEEGKAGVDGQVEAEEGVREGGGEREGVDKQNDTGDQSELNEGDAKCLEVVGAEEGEEAMEGMESDAVAMTTESDASPLAVGGVGEVESRESGSGESELQRGGGVEGEGEEEGGLEDPPADGADSEDRAPRNKCIGGADTYVSGGDGVFIADCSVDSVNGGFASEDLKEEEEKFVNAKEDVTNGIKSDDKESAKDEGEIGDIASSDSLCSEVKHSGGVVVAADVCDDVSGEVGGGEEEAVLGEGVAGGASVGNMLHDPPPLSVESSCGAGDGEEVKPPRAGGESVVVVSFSGAAAEGERIHIAASETREEGCEEGVARKDQISSQFHAKATAEQVSLSLSCEGGKGEEWGVGELETGGIRPPSEEKEEDSTTPALKNESGAPREEVGVTSTDGSEMAPPPVGERTSEADRREGGEAPEVTVGEETDPVPAGEPADPTATPASSLLPPLSPTPPPSPTLFPHRRLSLPADPSPPGENGQEEGRTSVDAWKAPREEDKVEALGCHAFGSGSLRWRSVGGGRDGESGRCVSLEDILNPEANARPFSGSGEAAVTTGGGGGVYTSYVMITQDGGVAREGLRRECGASDRQKEEEEEETVGGEEEGVAGERSSVEDVTSGRHQRVNVSVVEVSVVTSETTTLVSEEEDEEEEEMEEEEEGEVSSDEGGVVLKHVNWEEEEGKGNIGLAGYFTLTLETGTASPTPPRRPEIKSRKTIQLKDPSVPGDGVVDIPLCGGELSGGEMSAESDEGRNGGEDAVKVVTGGDTLSAVVCLEEGLADDDSWVEEVDASVDDIREEDDDELGSESASSGDEAYFDREEELRGYNRAIDFTLHTILEESGEESEAESHQKASQGVMGHHTSGSKHRSSVQNSEADASELEKYYFFGLGGIGGNHQDENNDDQKYINEESEISDTVSETSCSSIYSEGLESLGVAGAPGHDGISETADGIMGMDPADLASSRLEKYFLTGFLGLEPPRGLRAPLGDEDGFSENTDESGSVGSDSEGRPSPEQRRKRLVRARGAGRQHHNSGGSGGGAASDAEAATGSPSGGDLSNFSPQVTHTHSQVHHQQQQKLMGQQQQQQALQSQTSGQELGEGGDSSSGSDSFDETAFDKNDGQFDTVKRKKKKRKENRHQEGEAKEEGVAISGDDLDGSKTPQPDLETVAEEEEETGENEGGERMERADEVAAALEAENGMGMGPGGQGNRKQASRDSGFIGSCDDLLKDQQQQRISDGEQRSSGSDRDSKKSTQNDNKVEESVKEGALKKSEETQVPHEGDSKPALDVIGETEVAPLPAIRPVPSGSPASISRTSLSRKDSFNNWSSDEETNLMMSKMRAFFKTMVAGKMASAHCSGLRRSNSGKQSNGSEAHSASSSTNGDVPESAEKVKPPQLVYFENELTRLMKTVPGIRDEQVREIVEYLSSEDTWSDSYDSSDYTSSDLEGAGMGYHGRGPSGPLRTELQQQISASCQQIINNFDTCTDEMEEEDNFVRPKSATTPASDAMNRETAFVYQRLVASFGKVAGGVGEPSSSDASSTPHSSPPLIAKVMHHIGGRLVALMHEVSAAGSGEGGPLASSTSPNGTPFNRNNSAAGSPKTGNNQVAAAMAARYRRLLRREAAAAAKDDKGSVTSTSVESECPSTDTEERSVDSDADSSSSSPPPMSRLPSLPRSKSHDLGQWQRLLLTGEENRRVSAAHSYYYGVSGVGTSAVGGGVGVTGGMMSSSGVHSGGVGGRDNKESLRSSSSGVSDLAEEREEYERLSWKGSFESALAADSRTKLSLEAKRRSAGSGSGSASDLCSSNDQLDHRGRVRSCGSITSAGSRGSLLQQQQLGARARLSASGGDLLAYRSSASRGTVAEEHEGEGDDEGDGDVVGSSGALSRRRRSVPDARGPPGERSTTLPRSNTAVSASTNSLPRLPTVSAPPHGTAAAAIHKSQSLMGHHLQQAHQQQQQQQPHHHHHHLFLQNVKSARYRPPGFRPPPVPPVPPKRAVSVPGLNHQNRGRGERRRQSSGDDTISISENMGKGSSHAAGSTTPTVGSAPPTPGGGKKVSTGSSIGSWTNSPPNSPASTAGVHNATEDDPTNDRVPSVNPPNSSLGIRSDSMASVYSGAGEGRYGTVAVRGEVEFSLQYNYKQGALEISVKQCRDLAPVDTKRNRSDPYVKVYLLPDKSKSGKRKTKVKKHTLNPVFDETLKFHITLNGLETRTLWLTVWHSDMFGRNDFLGEVMMSLEKKVFDDPTPKWYPLQERTEPFDDLLCYKGEMIVGLKFVPPDVTNLHKKGRMSRGSLHVLVKDAKNLTAVKTNGTSDPFCKSYLLPDKGRSSKQKTAVCRRTINPVWNHTFVYEDVSLQELSERSLELTVWDHDRLASNEFLGGLRFNLGTGKHYGKNVDWMDATGREMTLWQSMLGRANFWVEGCLTLRPTLDHRSSPPSTLAS